MAIVKMKNFHLLALKTDKDELLRNLQIFKNVDFDQVDEEINGLEDIDVVKEVEELDNLINHSQFAIDYINKYYPKIGGLKALKEGLPNLTFSELEEKALLIDFDSIYSKIKNNADEVDAITYELNKAREEIEDIKVFRNLDVVPKHLSSLDRVKSYIGSISIKTKNEFENSLKSLDAVYLEQIGIRKEEAVYLVIHHEDDISEVNEVLKNSGFSKISLQLEKTVSDYREELSYKIESLVEDRKNLLEKLKELVVLRKDLEIYFEYVQNKRVRVLANNKAKESQAICVFTGYFPASQEDEFISLVYDVTRGAYSIEVKDADRNDEKTPIMLKNNKTLKAFEPITEMYALPRYNEMDPTPFMVPFYTVFFGMMSADAGYGLLILILCMVALKSFNLSIAMKKNIKFFAILSVFTILWGIAYNSYFGVKLEFMPQLLDMNEQVVQILVLAIIFGIIHLFTGLALKAYLYIREGDIIGAIFGVISWYVGLIGAGLTMLGSNLGLSDGIISISKYVMYIGFIMIIIGGGLEVKGNIGAKAGAGLYNLYGITGYVGDIVSYSRLLALGLSGSYIAFSVNTIAGMMFGNIVGILFAVVILIIFHAFNIFLSYLGAYVHGMRLIYVEFFGKFYEGGGKPFKYFRSASKYINLDRQLEE